MDYIEIDIRCSDDFRDILIAELAESDFDTFQETDEGFIAYIEKSKGYASALESLSEKYGSVCRLSYSVRDVKDKNWNEEWEKNYEPILVEDQCLIRASFHKVEQSYPYEILINPRMSFGTGHHETTYLMVQHQLEIDHQNKRTLDIGCGTGILAIMAALRGASRALAIDNNDWAYENAVENVRENGCKNIEVRLGDVHSAGVTGAFDIILANINRQALLDEAATYAGLLAPGGLILISGFYRQDSAVLTKRFSDLGVTKVSEKTKDGWAAILFKK